MKRLRSRGPCVAALIFLLGAGLVARADPCERQFRRGDPNGDLERNITDSLVILQSLFLDGGPLGCMSAGDVNDDGMVNLSDAVFLLNSLFLGTTEIPHPLECGLDPTPDLLGCEQYALCPPPVATEEICDGLDNDCDGEVDEDFSLADDLENCGLCGRRCEDLGWPNVKSYVCDSGNCMILECEEGYYDSDRIGETGCETTFPLDGTPCDDGNPCTENDFYIGGLCGGTPRDCSHLDNDCYIGACDRIGGECIQRPRPAGAPCDDGNPGTVHDVCNGRGFCVGIPVY